MGILAFQAVVPNGMGLKLRRGEEELPFLMIALETALVVGWTWT